MKTRLNQLYMKIGKLLLAIFLILNFSTQGITDSNAIGNKMNLLLGLILGLGIGFLLIRSAFKKRPADYKPKLLSSIIWTIVSVISAIGILDTFIDIDRFLL